MKSNSRALLNRSINRLVKNSVFISPTIPFALARLGRRAAALLSKFSPRSLSRLFGSPVLLESELPVAFERAAALRGVPEEAIEYAIESQLGRYPRRIFLKPDPGEGVGLYNRSGDIFVSIGTRDRTYEPLRAVPRILGHEIGHGWTIPRSFLLLERGGVKPELFDRVRMGPIPSKGLGEALAETSVFGYSDWWPKIEGVRPDLVRKFPSLFTGPVAPHELDILLKIYRPFSKMRPSSLGVRAEEAGNVYADLGMEYLENMLRAAKEGPEGYVLDPEDALEVFRNWFFRTSPDIREQAKLIAALSNRPAFRPTRWARGYPRIPSIILQEFEDMVNSRLIERLGRDRAYQVLRNRVWNRIRNNPELIREIQRSSGLMGRVRNLVGLYPEAKIMEPYDRVMKGIIRDYDIHRRALEEYYSKYPEEIFRFGSRAIPSEIADILKGLS